MKSVIVFALSMAGALGVAVAPVSIPWDRTLDAPPEALVTGAALLVVAFVLRRGLKYQRAKMTVGDIRSKINFVQR